MIFKIRKLDERIVIFIDDKILSLQNMFVEDSLSDREKEIILDKYVKFVKSFDLQ